MHADGKLAFDSRLEGYALQGLKVTGGINKGGTAEIIMPPGHPSYSLFTEYKTIVEIRRDGQMRFRGRALYHIDDMLNQRTVVCEGELCFFQDSVSRPYLFQAAPDAILTELVSIHNSQVEEQKRFKVGTITVTDPNDYVRMSSESAEQVLDTINKLLERCGGYIVFTTDPDDGARLINWYASMDYRSGQVIEFGENLLDFSRGGANTDLATAILPYGAKDETTGLRVTIESVNDGQDYIQDDEAVAIRGFIIKPVFWDDVTKPANLLRKAREWLLANRYIVTALQLSALDLSYIDKNIDTFQVGDNIRVKSKPHKLDDYFLLTERTEDLLNPANSSISLGKELSTLTSADVAGDSRSQDAIERTAQQLTADYTLNLANAIQASEKLLSSLIDQASDAIKMEVSEQYLSNDEVTEAISTRMSILKDEVLIEFETLKATVDSGDAESRAQIEQIHKYISFEDGNIKLGSSDSAITLTLENDLLVFNKNGLPFGWWDGVDFHTGNIVVKVNERAQFGDFAFVPRTNGSLSFLKVGG
jgi:phage minor structural protein